MLEYTKYIYSKCIHNSNRDTHVDVDGVWSVSMDACVKYLIVSCPECSYIGLRLIQKKTQCMAFCMYVSFNAGFGWENEFFLAKFKIQSQEMMR